MNKQGNFSITLHVHALNLEHQTACPCLVQQLMLTKQMNLKQNQKRLYVKAHPRDKG